MKPASAFTILEMMLAIAIFSIAVVGVIQGMNRTIRSSSMVEETAYVRQQLNSLMVETRLKKLSEGTTTSVPDGRGVVYTTVTEPLKLRDRHGRELPSLFRLRLRANWVGPEGPQSESAEEYVFQASSTAR